MKLAKLAFALWSVEIASLSYVDDLHTLAITVLILIQQIECVEKFNDMNSTIMNPEEGEIKLVTNTAELVVLARDGPVKAKGMPLTVENGCVLTQARMLGGCLHNDKSPCKWRAERDEELQDDLSRCKYVPSHKCTIQRLCDWDLFLFQLLIRE